MSQPPPIIATPGLPSSSIIFTSSGSTRIAAPPSHVFNIITNLASYSSWNQNTPQMTPQSPGPLQVGSTITMKIVMAEQNNKEYDIPIELLQLDQPNSDGVYVIAWRGQLMPTWFAVSERVQEIRPVDGEVEMCEVKNYESMAGWGAYVFKYVMGIPGQMEKFNAKYLEDLKKEAESTFKTGASS